MSQALLALATAVLVILTHQHNVVTVASEKFENISFLKKLCFPLDFSFWVILLVPLFLEVSFHPCGFPFARFCGLFFLNFLIVVVSSVLLFIRLPLINPLPPVSGTLVQDCYSV